MDTCIVYGWHKGGKLHKHEHVSIQRNVIYTMLCNVYKVYKIIMRWYRNYVFKTVPLYSPYQALDSPCFLNNIGTHDEKDTEEVTGSRMY